MTLKIALAKNEKEWIIIRKIVDIDKTSFIRAVSFQNWVIMALHISLVPLSNIFLSFFIPVPPSIYVYSLSRLLSISLRFLLLSMYPVSIWFFGAFFLIMCSHNFSYLLQGFACSSYLLLLLYTIILQKVVDHGSPRLHASFSFNSPLCGYCYVIHSFKLIYCLPHSLSCLQ